MKLSPLMDGVLGSLLGKAPEPQICIPMSWGGGLDPRASVSAIRPATYTVTHLTPTQPLTPPGEGGIDTGGGEKPNSSGRSMASREQKETRR